MRTKFIAESARPEQELLLQIGGRDMPVNTYSRMPMSGRQRWRSLIQEEAELHRICTGVLEDDRKLGDEEWKVPPRSRTKEEQDRLDEVALLTFRCFAPDITKAEMDGLTKNEVDDIFKWLGEVEGEELKKEEADNEDPTSGSSDETP